ncbi:MAG: hypothetical protein P4M08_06025 [Oligoflexia bacterium]|nr:hypothetical protein [Oligoflexia bacterium]
MAVFTVFIIFASALWGPCLWAANVAAKKTAKAPAKTTVKATPTPKSKIPAPIKERFASVCLHAYEVSTSKADAAATGRQLCECTARESELQGVTAANLEKETDKIQRDPKYTIQDKLLLDAMRICLIDMYADKMKRERKPSPKARKPNPRLTARKPSPKPSKKPNVRPSASPN